MTISEDDLLYYFAGLLREKNFIILSIGSKQCSAFKFFLVSGRRKAPDLVAYKNGILCIFEAKAKAGELFRKRNGQESDFDALQELINSPTQLAGLCEETNRRLRALGEVFSKQIVVICGIIAGNSFCKYKNLIHQGNVFTISVDYYNDAVEFFNQNEYWEKIWDEEL